MAEPSQSFYNFSVCLKIEKSEIFKYETETLTRRVSNTRFRVIW